MAAQDEGRPGTTIRFRIFRRQGGGTGVTSREGGYDSGHMFFYPNKVLFQKECEDILIEF